MIGHATQKFAFPLPARRAKALRSGAKIDNEGLYGTLALFIFQCSTNFGASLNRTAIVARAWNRSVAQCGTRAASESEGCHAEGREIAEVTSAIFCRLIFRRCCHQIRKFFATGPSGHKVIQLTRALHR